MIDDASWPTTSWSTMNQDPASVFGIDSMEVEVGFNASADSDSIVRPYQRSTFVATTAPARYRRRPVGHIEKMLLASQMLSQPRSRILWALLDAANPECCDINTRLKPLWANEAMHRAYQTVRLTRLLDDRISCSDQEPAEIDLEWRVAKNLAETVRSLCIVRDAEKLPCSEALRDVVRDLVELFGDAVGIADISTSVERMELASFKRRALVLVAGHLVIELLLHAFRAGRGGQVLVILDRPCHWCGRLAVGYADHAMPFGPLDGRYGVINDLASLLECDVTYRAGGGRIVTEIEFPLR